MAIVGSITSNNTKTENIGVYLYTIFSWSRAEYSINDNTSTIAWSLTLYNSGKTSFLSDFFGSGKDSCSITIGGTKVYSNEKVDTSVKADSSKIIATGRTIIPHNKDGTGSFNVVTNLTINSSISTYPYDDSKIQANVILNPLPRPAIIKTAQNFSEYDNPTITYSSPSGIISGTVEACISLTGATDDIAYRDVGTSGSYTFNLTAAERNVLRRAVINDNSISVKFYIRNTIDGAQYLSNLTKTFSMVDYEPILSPSVIDTNYRTMLLTGNAQKLIKYYSNAFVTFGAVARTGATIVSRSVTNGDKTFNIEDSSQDGIAINNVDSNTFYLSATDSRGYTKRDFLVLSEDNGDFVPYVKLTNSLTTNLLSPTGELTFTVKGKYFNGSFGAKDNSLEVEYLVLDENGNPVFNTGGSGWVQLGTVYPTMDDNNYSYSYTISGLNHEGTYELTVNVIDELTPVQTATKIISATPIFDWGKDDFRFNVPVYLKDSDTPLTAAADIVIEQGTSNTWFYRKWQSGRVELYGYQNISSLACSTSLGNMYRTVEQTAPSFPFTVYSPKATATYESDGYGAFLWPTRITTTARPFSYYLVRPTSSTGISGKVNFHVQGSWK